jgi:uncharacterized small protein (DUF1192 family)
MGKEPASVESPKEEKQRLEAEKKENCAMRNEYMSAFNEEKDDKKKADRLWEMVTALNREIASLDGRIERLDAKIDRSASGECAPHAQAHTSTLPQ